MKETMTKIFPVWKELAKQALEWDYEKVYSHQEIGKILDIEPQTEKYYAAVGAARDALIECGLLLSTNIGNGYYITEPNRHAEEAHKDLKKSRDFARRNLMKLLMARVEEMDENSRIRHDLATVKSRGINDMLEPAYVEITTIITKKLFQIKESRPKRNDEE